MKENGSSSKEDESLGCVSSLSSEDDTQDPTVFDGSACDWYTMLQETARARLKQRSHHHAPIDPLLASSLAWSSPPVVGVVLPFRCDYLKVDVDGGSDIFVKSSRHGDAGFERRYELSAACHATGLYDMVGVALCAALCPAACDRDNTARKARCVIACGGNAATSEMRRLLLALIQDAASRVPMKHSTMVDRHPLILSAEAVATKDGARRETLPPTGAGGGGTSPTRAERLVDHAFRLTDNEHVVVTVEYAGHRVQVARLSSGSTLDTMCSVLRKHAAAVDENDGVAPAQVALASMLNGKPIVVCCVSAREPPLALLEWAHRRRVPCSSNRAVAEARLAGDADSAALDAVLAKFRPPSVSQLALRSPPRKSLHEDLSVTPIRSPQRREYQWEHQWPSPPLLLENAAKVVVEHKAEEEEVTTSTTTVTKVDETNRLLTAEMAERSEAISELESVLAETKAARTKALREALEAAREARSERDAMFRSAREAAEAARAEVELRARAESAETEAATRARHAARKVSKLEARASDAEAVAERAQLAEQTARDGLLAAEAVAAALQQSETVSSDEHILVDLEKRAAVLEAELEASRSRADAERTARLEARREAERERQAARQAVQAITHAATQQLEDALRDVRDSVAQQADAARTALRQLAEERDAAVRDSRLLADRLDTVRADAQVLRCDLAKAKLTAKPPRLVAAAEPPPPHQVMNDDAPTLPTLQPSSFAPTPQPPLVPPAQAAVEPPPPPPVVAPVPPQVEVSAPPPVSAPIPHVDEVADEREATLRQALRDRERELEELRASSRREAAALWLAVNRAEDALHLATTRLSSSEQTPIEPADPEQLLENSLASDLHTLDNRLAAVRCNKTTTREPTAQRVRLGSRQTVDRVERTNRNVLDFLELSSSQQRRHLSPERVLSSLPSETTSHHSDNQSEPGGSVGNEVDHSFYQENDHVSRRSPTMTKAPQSRQRTRQTPNISVHDFPRTLRSAYKTPTSRAAAAKRRSRPFVN